MGLDLLDTPVRITWDLTGSTGTLGSADLRQIADRLVDAGLFFVTLDEQPLRVPTIADLLQRLAGGGCQAMVSTDGTASELAALDASLPLSALLLNVAPYLNDEGLDRAALEESVRQLRQRGFEPTPMLTPLRSNLHLIPEILQVCSTLGIAKFKLPNAKINDSFRAYSVVDLPRFEQLESFAESWQEFAGKQPDLPGLEIHDLFLWEIMTPGHRDTRSEYGGCQAGNSLGYVDSRGQLFPCAAWPTPLGSLLEQPLAELWQSAARHAIRAEVASVPEGCLDCADLKLCHGGCRGLACLYNAEQGGRDLMCRAPRS